MLTLHTNREASDITITFIIFNPKLGVLYVMWSNVGEGNTVVKRTDSCSDVDTLDSEDDSEDENAHHKMSVDCAASSKGLFLGILVFVISVVCIVCFYVLTSVQSHLAVGTLLGELQNVYLIFI